MSNVRVAILSTPRCGNTWLNRLVSRAFAVEQRSFHRPRRAPYALGGLGPRGGGRVAPPRGLARRRAGAADLGSRGRVFAGPNAPRPAAGADAKTLLARPTRPVAEAVLRPRTDPTARG